MALVAGLTIPDIKSVFWRKVRVTADGSGNVTASFGTQLGRRHYFILIRKTTALTLTTAFATPQYSGPVTIPSNKSQMIPVDCSLASDPVIALFPLDPAQDYQLSLTGLDAAGVYDVAIATDYSFDSSNNQNCQ